MSRKFLSLMLSLTLLLGLCGVPPALAAGSTPTIYSNVEGQGIPYLYDISTHSYINGNNNTVLTPAVGDIVCISSDKDLSYFSDYVNSGRLVNRCTWRLTEDIDIIDSAAADSYRFSPIGAADRRFFGTFDGDGHTISFTLGEETSTTHQGLFGFISGAKVMNLTVDSPVFSANGAYLGGIAGEAFNSSIENCHVVSDRSIDVESGLFNGGLIGKAIDCDILDCTNEGTIRVVVASGYVGGIVGDCINTKIVGCSNRANLSGGLYAGGIAGSSTRSGIFQSFNTGDIDAGSDIPSISGGIVGRITGDLASPGVGGVTQCFNTGTVSAGASAGGIVGQVANSIISDCFHTGALSQSTAACGIAGIATHSEISGCYAAFRPESNSGIFPITPRTVAVADCFYDQTFFPDRKLQVQVGHFW